MHELAKRFTRFACFADPARSLEIQLTSYLQVISKDIIKLTNQSVISKTILAQQR